MSNCVNLFGYKLSITNLHNKYNGYFSISMLYPVKPTTYELFQIFVLNYNNFSVVLDYRIKAYFYFFYTFSYILIEIINAHAAICEGL
jgi:hypothetical protein